MLSLETQLVSGTRTYTRGSMMSVMPDSVVISRPDSVSILALVLAISSPVPSVVCGRQIVRGVMAGGIIGNSSSTAEPVSSSMATSSSS